MRAVLVCCLLFMALSSPAASDPRWWATVSHPDGFNLILRKRPIAPIPYADPELHGGMREENIFGYFADHLDSPLFKELRRLQRDYATVLYGKIESDRRDSLSWNEGQMLAAVMKNGSVVYADQVLAAFRPSLDLTTENSRLTFGGGEIMQIYPYSKKGRHPPFLLDDIRMEVLVNGEDRSHYMIFVVMNRGFDASSVDHWLVEDKSKLAALSGAKGR